jgi:[histone H3]-lysine4 N-trimethyltransferase SETD1
LQHDPRPIADPRLAIANYPSSYFAAVAKHIKPRCRPAPYKVKEPVWDRVTSIGRGPPTRVVVHAYDPLTVTETKIRSMLSQFGDVAEAKNQIDPNTGSFLGICSVSFRNKQSRDGKIITAVDAAQIAVKEGSGQRIDQWPVTIELDPDGLRSKRYIEKFTKERRRALENEFRVDKTRVAKPAAPSAPSAPAVVAPAATSGASAAETPPPNAPKGPSGKPPPQGPRQLVPRPTAHSLVEETPILQTIKRKPYIFIAHCYVPVLGTTISHLQRRMRMYDWNEIRCDQTGYFIIFQDSRRGEDEARRCFKDCHLQLLFTYTMNMDCQPQGNPLYERSPTPERVAAELLIKKERQNIKQEDEQDFEMEKRERAENLDPAKAMLDQLVPALREWVILDIKNQIANSTLYNLLDPAKQADRRKKYNVPPPPMPDVKRPFNIIGEVPTANSPGSRAALGGYKGSLNRLRRSRPDQRKLDPYTDDRRRKSTRPFQSLFSRLEGFESDGGSDDERHTSVTRGSDGFDSRAISEAARSPAQFEQEDGHLTPHTKRRRIGHGPESDAESVDAVTRKSLGSLFDKDPTDMTIRELEKVTKLLPRTSEKHKHAVTEVLLRKKAVEDDALFSVGGKLDDDDAFDVKIKVDNGDSVTATPEPPEVIKSKKKAAPKTKRKTKKQLQEEQDAIVRAATTAELDKVIADAEETPAPSMIEEKHTPERRLEVEWGVSTTRPRRTVEDDKSIVHDLDGWQYLIKGEANESISEDIEFLRLALLDTLPLTLGADPDYWCWKEKQFKTLNTQSPRESVTISGYYIPNASGCARTEPVQKIKETEKSKYLPHRIKVKNLREKRQAEAKTALPESTAKALNAVKSSNVTSRTNRAEIRRQQNVITSTKLASDIDSDAVRFNQLKKRKKNVRFDRSSIHGWGLYAEESITMGDMIIEYVGEKVRTRVAECREAMYAKQGIGSSYLFRIDDDMVIDATKKGGIARFINHSCLPNCTAKIIKVEGTKRIVIYALRDIQQSKSIKPFFCSTLTCIR